VRDFDAHYGLRPGDRSRRPRSYVPVCAAKSIHIDAAVADSQHENKHRWKGWRPGQRDCGGRSVYDCVFVEDTAVVWRDQALVTRMAPHREGQRA
jgi:N-dimethylarginine dimethylaminohydrolase